MDNIVSSNNVRLYDVFISGPFYIIIGLLCKNKSLKIIMLTIGIFTILYNFMNYKNIV